MHLQRLFADRNEARYSEGNFVHPSLYTITITIILTLTTIIITIKATLIDLFDRAVSAQVPIALVLYDAWTYYCYPNFNSRHEWTESDFAGIPRLV